MANYKTGAQRYNDRMDKIFEHAKGEKRGLVGNSHTKGVGVNSPAMNKARTEALKKRKTENAKQMVKKIYPELSDAYEGLMGLTIRKDKSE